jgi:thiol-disulfide isomerase/thioredoxin
VNNGGINGLNVIADGKKIYTSLPQLKRYTEEDSAASFKDIIKASPAWRSGEMLTLIAMFGQDPAEALLADSARAVIIEDEGSDTRVVHIRIEKKPGADGRTIDLWIGTDDHLLHRVDLDLSGSMPQTDPLTPEGMKMVITELHREIKLDQAVPADVFSFTAPEGFQKMSDLAAPASPGSASARPVAEGQDKNSGAFVFLLGKPAPDFKLEGLKKGVALKLADGKDKAILLDFWATWCGPCKKELPVLQKIYEKYQGKGAIFIAVNAHEPRDKVERFAADNKLTIPVGLDSDGKMEEAYGVSDVLPTTVLIDRKGVIRRVYYGFEPDMEKKISADLDVLLAGRELPI